MSKFGSERLMRHHDDSADSVTKSETGINYLKRAQAYIDARTKYSAYQMNLGDIGFQMMCPPRQEGELSTGLTESGRLDVLASMKSDIYQAFSLGPIDEAQKNYYDDRYGKEKYPNPWHPNPKLYTYLPIEEIKAIFREIKKIYEAENNQWGLYTIDETAEDLIKALHPSTAQQKKRKSRKKVEV